MLLLEELLLFDRLEAADTIVGTHAFHAYLPLQATRNSMDKTILQRIYIGDVITLAKNSWLRYL